MFRGFILNWPNLCLLTMSGEDNIDMWAANSNYKKRSTGATLVKKAIEAVVKDDADKVVLGTEITNKPALEL